MPAPNNLSVADLCNRILGTIDDAAIQGNLAEIKPDQQFVAKIASPENRAQAWFDNIDNIDEADGKLRVLSARYLPRTCPGTEDFEQVICTGGAMPGYKYADLTVRQPALYGQPINFKWKDIRTFCEGKDEFTNIIFAKNRDLMRTLLNYKVLHHLRTGTNHTDGSYIGKFANGVTGTKDVPLFFSNPVAWNRINPVGEQIISQDMINAKMYTGGSPYIFGYGVWQPYFEAKNRNGFSNTGDDASKLRALLGQNYYLDQHIDREYAATATPTDNAFVIQPGALQLLTYNRNRGDFGLTLPNQQRGVIPDPAIPGLFYDYIMNINFCDDDIDMTWQLSLRWDLAGLPDDIYGLECDNTGVNGVFHYRGVCADTQICAAIVANNPTRPEVDIDATRAGAIVTIVTTTTTPASDMLTIDIGGNTLVGLSGDPISPAITGITGDYDNFDVDTAVYLKLSDTVHADSQTVPGGITSIGDFAIVPAA